jgi:signal transduction histidine kinase
MSISTRLILLLMMLVSLVMVAAGYYFLQQRQGILESAMHNEVRAHAGTLQLMLEEDFRAGRDRDAQQFINQLSQNPKIYSVILYDEQGQITMLSDPLVADEIRFPPEVRQVLATGEPIEFVRRIGAQKVFSIIMPIRISETRRGAFEITQPRSFIEADFAAARRDIVIITLTLFAVILWGVLVVLRRNLARPIRELLTGAMALGEGELEFRVVVPKGGNELTKLASEFNRMADRLTEQRQAAAQAASEQLKLEQQLLIAERFAALGRVAGGVAHEMGAPLNVIKGRIEQLLENPTVPREKLERNLTIINQQADEIVRTVRQLLNLGRPVALQRVPVAVSELLQRMQERLADEAAPRKMSLQVDTADERYILGDPEMLHQVLMNIGRNGLQAMTEPGQLRVEVLGEETVKEAQAFLALRFADTGPGIAPEHINQIFDPFFTTKDVGQGMGLGLSLTRRIVEDHQGWIEVSNQPTGGAIFTVWLPKASRAALAAAERK